MQMTTDNCKKSSVNPLYLLQIPETHESRKIHMSDAPIKKNGRRNHLWVVFYSLSVCESGKGLIGATAVMYRSAFAVGQALKLQAVTAAKWPKVPASGDKRPRFLAYRKLPMPTALLCTAFLQSKQCVSQTAS